MLMKTTRLNHCDVDENYKAYPLWCWWKLQGFPLVTFDEKLQGLPLVTFGEKLQGLPLVMLMGKLQGLPLVMLMKTTRLTPCDGENYKA